MFIFFLSSVLSGMALGFIGFQLIAACDKLGFAGIDLYGIIMLAFAGPILISSVNLITGGRESSKVLATGLASFFLFSFMHPRAAHSVLGAAGMMNPLVTMANMAFVTVIFITAAMLIWNFSRGKIMTASPRPLGAALLILAVCGISFGVWQQMRGQRETWYANFLQKNDSLAREAGKMKSAAMCSMPLGLPLGPEPTANVWKAIGTEFDSMAQAGLKNAMFRCYLPLRGQTERNWPQDERVVAMARERGLGIVIQDSVASVTVRNSSATDELQAPYGVSLETFLTERVKGASEVAARIRPDYYVVLGEPGFYYLSGVTGEFTPASWIAGAERISAGINGASPTTSCGLSMNIMDLFGDRLSGNGTPISESAASATEEVTQDRIRVRLKALQSDLYRFMRESDWTPETSHLDFIGMRLYFKEQAERLEVLIGDGLLPLDQGPDLWIIETWNGWALAPPRAGSLDSAWIRGISGLVARAGFRGLVYTPFGNFREGVYYGDFREIEKTTPLSEPLMTIANIMGVSVEIPSAAPQGVTGEAR